MVGVYKNRSRKEQTIAAAAVAEVAAAATTAKPTAKVFLINYFFEIIHIVISFVSFIHRSIINVHFLSSSFFR